MAKYKVLKTFRDIHTKAVYTQDAEIELPVKRAEEVEENIGGSFLERIDKEEKEKKAENKKKKK